MSLGFIGGLGAAMQGYTEASKDWEKREQASAAEQRRAEDHAYQQQKHQIEMDEIERTKTIRNETEAAAKPLEVQTEEIPPPEGDPFTSIRKSYKAGDQTFTDEAKAKAYAADPYEAGKRAAGVKLKYGDVDGSLSIGQKLISSRMDDLKFADATRAQEAAVINDTMTKRLFDPKGVDLWGNGASILSELDKDGNTYKAEKRANGTIVMNKYAPDGTPLGQHGSAFPDTYEGQRAFAGGFMNAPTWKEKSDQLAAWAKAQHEARKEELKTKVDESIIQRNTAQAQGTGGYAKQPKEPKAPKPDAISEGFKHFSPDNKAGRAEGENLARQAKALNPGATDQELIYAAQAAVVDGLDSPNIKQRLDFNTGQVTAVFTDPRTGKPIKLHQAPPKPEMAPMLRTEVEQYLKEQNQLGVSLGSQTQWSDALRRAAANPKDSAAVAQVVQNTIASTLPTAQATIMRQWKTVNAQRRAAGQPEYPQPTPDDILAKVAQTVNGPQGMAVINNRLNLIRTYGPK